MTWFTEDEFRCKCCGGLGNRDNLHKLMMALDKVREIYGSPMKIMSGYRCAQHNAKVGGVPSSKHREALAADIVAPSSREKFFLVKAALACGFTRIGVGKDFIHLDIGDEPKEVLWTY